ncbi:MAG: NAD(P)/FAD-dependent oxidoreductase, partial [Deltaproteobacteria bacterium]|nr:NAD(P)/FAD-dependent oxidoreductase [Deltaproteobacteria bacterium]
AEVGTPVRCAEYVPSGVREFAALSPAAVAQQLEALVTHLPSGRKQVTRAPGYTVDRRLFDQGLVGEALAAGAELWLRAPVLREERGGFVVRREGATVLGRAQVTIGADGPSSVVARSLGNPPQRTAAGAQVTVRLRGRLSAAEVFFGPECPGGYGWLFPKGERANVGVAVDRRLGGGARIALAALLRRLEEAAIVLPVSVERRTGGAVPLGGPRPCIQAGRVLLVGDAAGHTHPITGAGIYHALVGGRTAGRLAADAVALGDARVLGEYGERCRSWLGRTLERAAERRAAYEACWRRGEIGDELIRRTWVAFQEYYRDAA